MNPGARIVGAWNKFWFRNVDPHSLAAFRILFGSYLFIYFLRFAPHVEIMFSNHGVYTPFLFGDIGLPVFWAWVVYLCLLIVIGAFILGFRTRFVTPLLLVLFLYYFFLNLAVNNTAFDRLNIIFLVILCFADLDEAWAVRGHRPLAGNKERLVSVWAIRVLSIQIVLLYFGAGFWKLISPYWHTGEMMRWTLIGPWGTDLAFFLARLNPPSVFYDLLTWSVLVFELTVSFFLFNKRLQVYAFIVGFLFHLSIACLLNIPEFMNCVCTYVLFVDPKLVQRYGNRIFQKIGDAFVRLSKD